MKLTLRVLTAIFGFAALSGTSMAAKDAGHDHDYRTFHASGEIDYGKIGDSYTADLVMYLAGNQFMVMEDLIKDFHSKHPDIKTVYVETIPPGQILKKQLLLSACSLSLQHQQLLGEQGNYSLPGQGHQG